MIKKVFAVLLCLTLLLPGFKVSALEKSIEELSEETGITNSESSFTIPLWPKCLWIAEKRHLLMNRMKYRSNVSLCISRRA